MAQAQRTPRPVCKHAFSVSPAVHRHPHRGERKENLPVFPKKSTPFSADKNITCSLTEHIVI